jgi:hypothetical protein
MLNNNLQAKEGQVIPACHCKLGVSENWLFFHWIAFIKGFGWNKFVYVKELQFLKCAIELFECILVGPTLASYLDFGVVGTVYFSLKLLLFVI